jgi:undecaprenyl-diphosphatase
MTIIEAIILGIIQGATEFLPISSSGHMVLIPASFNMTQPDLNAVAIAHLGTLLAVLVYFYKDLRDILTGTISGIKKGELMGTTEARLGWYIVVGSIPAAAAGLTLEDYFDKIFGTPTIAASFLLFTAALLLFGEYKRSGEKTLSKMSWLDAITIGFFQMIALFPGISRSGSTIVGGLLRGLDRELAARYSFLLGVPAILGAGMLSLFDLVGSADFNSQVPALVTTFVFSAIVGYACIHFLLQWLKQRSLIPFALYCSAFGIIFLVINAL